jgi:hypothetical protein
MMFLGMRSLAQSHVKQHVLSSVIKSSCRRLSNWSHQCHALKQQRTGGLSQEEIAARIAASQARKAQGKAAQICCPSCNQPQVAVRRLLVHMDKCCPDLLEDQQHWEQVG